MRIVADRNIPQVAEAFAALGAVEVVPASAITPALVRDADVLLCRSTIKVGAPLLDGSRVRFVATATIGTDHLDLGWLAAQNIRVASAPGSNADSVVQWIAAALRFLSDHTGRDLSRARIGVVGVGQVGRRVARMAALLAESWGSAPPLLCDPPRARHEPGFVPLEEVLAGSDLVTLHVPLTKAGPDATVRMLDATRLALLRPGAVLINAARGEVVDEPALLAARAQLSALALDVFPGEPRPSRALVDACTLATPHIAGHSIEGKLAGTRMIYEAACDHLGIAPSWQPVAPKPVPARLDLDPAAPPAHLLLHALCAKYDIAFDDGAMRAISSATDGAAAFALHRSNYAVRHEIKAYESYIYDTIPDLLSRLRSIC
jgi:erythronate-4-phosphate dehydrogenase